MEERRRFVVFFLLVLMVLLASIHQSVALPSPTKIITGMLSNVLSALWNRFWSFIPITRSVKFESGYTVETVFDGTKHGIEPHSVEVDHNGDLLLLDSVNSAIYRIFPPLTRYSRPKLVAGSAEGYSGHVDGKPREARMNHPRGFALDDRGNIYVADTSNTAIRKVNDRGVTTIAGGKSKSKEHVDGPSEFAKFSADFDLVYITSSCSLLIVDRGYHAIREIQLHIDDCSSHYVNGVTLGIIGLCLAGFFGYMIAFLQHRLLLKDEPRTPRRGSTPYYYQKIVKASIRRPLIQSEDEAVMEEEGSLFTSIWNLFSGLLGFFSVFRRKTHQYSNQNLFCHHQASNSWPVEESFMISKEDQPPPMEPSTPTPRKSYAFMSNYPEKLQQLKQNQAYYNEWSEEPKKQ